VGSIVSGIVASKVGRSSEITKGVVNIIPSIVQFYSTHGSTCELTITGIGGQQFGIHGDSGSAVWDEKGRLVGILWGSALRKRTDFLNPLHKIIGSNAADITGANYGLKPCGVEDQDKLAF
jgi:hypothetical protein